MKTYCGVFQDGLEIKIACLKKHGKKLQVQKLISVPSSEHQFILTPNTASDLNEDFSLDLNEIADNTQPQTALSDLIDHYPIENLKFIPVITEPQISYLVYNPSSQKKNADIKTELIGLWKDLTNAELDRNKVDFIEYKNNSYISSIVHEEIPILNELKNLSLISETKSLDILSLRSGDISLLNYVLRFYSPGKEETFLIIYVGTDSIRMIFIKDGKAIHINRYLSINYERQGLVSFLSSKIVLEMEYAGISELNHILLTGEVNDDLLSAFIQSFPFTSVNYLSLDVFDLSPLSDEDKLKIQSYSLPLVAVLDELYPYYGVKKNLDVHSKRLSKISLIQRIDFVSIFLFILLFGLIAYSSWTYLERSRNLKTLKIQTAKVNLLKSNSSEDLAKIELLNRKYEVLNTYMTKLDEFLQDRIWWTDELMTIHSFNPRKNKMWLTSLGIDEKNPNLLTLKGLAIDRSKIPEFMKVLRNAELKNIYLYEIRGKKIFQFELTANIK